MAIGGTIFARTEPRRDGTVVLFLILAAALIVIGGVLAAGRSVEAGMVVVAVCVGYAVWRWTLPACLFLVAFTPVNRFVIFVLFSATGSHTLLRGAQLWKDAIIGVALLRVLHEACIRRQAPRIYFLDVLVVMFLLLNAVYVLYPGTLDDNNLEGRVLGFRLDAYFLLAYFVGRGLSLERRHVRRFVLALIPGSIAVALVAAVQWFFPDASNRWWNVLGFQEFVVAVNGSSNIAVRTRDLAGLAIPRSSSLLMGDLALAFYTLLIVPIAAALYFAKGRRGLGLASLGFLLLMLATLAMSGARSAMLAAPIGLVLLAFFTVSYGKAFVTVGLVAVLGLAAIVFYSGGIDRQWFNALLSPGEGSAVAHASAMRDSFKIIEEEPFGRGLGTSHTVGYQLRIRSAFANESWYLQLATEIGIAGAALYALIMAAVTIGPLLAYTRIKDYWLRVLTIGAGGAGAGFAMVGLVLHVWEAPVIGAVFWLLAGIATRAIDLESSWSGQPPEP